MISWETCEPVYRLALEWTTAADGSPVGYDDGAAYDSIESTITGRLTPDELEALESAYKFDRTYTLVSTGYLLGPEVDLSMGVTVKIADLVVDGPCDSSMTCFDVTASVVYGPIATPSAGDLSIALSHGVPYHAVRPDTQISEMCDGSSATASVAPLVDATCRWYASQLTTAQADSVVRALRLLREGSYEWITPFGVEPWGPGIDGSAFVWIPEWSVHAESNLTWGIELLLVRNPEFTPTPSYRIIGDDGSPFVGDDGSYFVGVV